MGLGNGNAKSGNKGSNHNFEFRNLTLLGQILAASGGGSGPVAGGSTEATQLLVKALLEQIEASNDLIVASNGNIDDNIDASTWDTTVGNSKILSYYAGSVAGHPATSTSEVETIEFRSDGGAVLHFTQTFTYDAANNVLTIVTT